MKKSIIVAVTALAFFLLHSISCNQTKPTEIKTDTTNETLIKKVSQEKPEIEPKKEIITITFPKSENPTSPIPQGPLSDEEIQEFVQFIKYFNEKGDSWYTFGGSLEQFPPDLDGSPQAKCLELSAEKINYCTWYTDSEWQLGKIFAQFVIYNYKLGDQKTAGQIAWILDENIPWAKFLVAAWSEYFIPKYRDFNFDHQLDVVTSWTDEIITKEGEKKYSYERRYDQVTIKPVREKNGLLANLYQCVPDPINENEQRCPWQEYTDKSIERKLDGLDRAIFYLGPQGTKKTIRLLEDITDILMHHPEKKIAIQ